MSALDRDPLFVGLTRPQLLLGVPYGYAVGNAVATTELFLLARSPWVLAFALLAHAIGLAACRREPRLFHLWLVRVRRCPRVPNRRVWTCNSYRP